MGKNLNNVDGGQTTSPEEGRFYIIKPAATSSGFQDYWISEEDLHAALYAAILANSNAISNHYNRIVTLESSILKTKISNLSGIYSFNMYADSSLDSIYIKYKSGNPVVSIGLNSGTGDEYLKNYMLNSISDNTSLTLNELYNYNTQINIKVTDGVIDFVRYTKINIF